MFAWRKLSSHFYAGSVLETSCLTALCTNNCSGVIYVSTFVNWKNGDERILQNVRSKCLFGTVGIRTKQLSAEHGCVIVFLLTRPSKTSKTHTEVTKRFLKYRSANESLTGATTTSPRKTSKRLLGTDATAWPSEFRWALLYPTLTQTFGEL